MWRIAALLGVPVSYCWSPTLLPQPSDWPATAEVVGFCQLEASDRMNYSPPEDLVQFLAAGPPPVYIGFGSMTLKHPHVRLLLWCPCSCACTASFPATLSSKLLKQTQSPAVGVPE